MTHVLCLVRNNRVSFPKEPSSHCLYIKRFDIQHMLNPPVFSKNPEKSFSSCITAVHSHSVCMHLSLSMHTASFAYCPPTTTAISLNPCINYLCHLFFFLNFMPMQFFSSPLHHLSLPYTLNMPLSLTIVATIKLVEQHSRESRTAVYFAIQSSRRHVTKKGIKKTTPNKKKDITTVNSQT